MLRPVYLVAFSGHRPSHGRGRTDSDLMAVAPDLERALGKLKSDVEANGGELQCISSLAAGSDLIACRAALRLGLPLHIILPFPEEEFFDTGFLEKDHVAAWKEPALRILAAVHPHSKLPPAPPCVCPGILPLTHDDGSPLDLTPSRRHTFRILDSAGTTTERYALTNARMLEAADGLLLVFVTGSEDSAAGTARLKNQADAISLPHVCIDPLHQVTTEHHFLNFADPRAPSRELMNRIGSHVSCDLATGDPFAALVDCLRRQANENARRFRFATGSAITLHALAGFIAALAAACYYYLKKESPNYLAYFAIFALVELILVGIAFALEWLGHRRHERETWHLCRFARELLRGIEASSLFLDPLFPEISRHRREWDRFAVTAGLLLRQQREPLSPADLLAARDAYVKDRVLNQHGKYKSDAEHAKIPAKLFKNIAHWAALLALPVVAFAALVKMAEFIDPRHPLIHLDKHSIFTPLLLLFLPILLPLAASLGTSFIATFDFARRAARYPEMVRALEQTSKLLPTLDTLPAVTESIRRTEEILTDELIDWHASQLS